MKTIFGVSWQDFSGFFFFLFYFFFLSCSSHSYLILSNKKPWWSEFWLPFRSVAFLPQLLWQCSRENELVLSSFVILDFPCQMQHRNLEGFCCDDSIEQWCLYHIVLCLFSPCKFCTLFFWTSPSLPGRTWYIIFMERGEKKKKGEKYS